MGDRNDSPIVVTGLGRSGTTWMQWFLSHHPRIQIAGQPATDLDWSTLWGWCQTLVDRAALTVRANDLHGYEIPAYAGTTPENAQTLFKQLFRDYFTGFGPAAVGGFKPASPAKPRWGIKWLLLCADPQQVEQFESLWPETRWIVCLRNPFDVIASTRNTFVPDADLRALATNWLHTCHFVESHPPERVRVVQLDRLRDASEDKRRTALNEVLACIGEEPTAGNRKYKYILAMRGTLAGVVGTQQPHAGDRRWRGGATTRSRRFGVI